MTGQQRPCIMAQWRLAVERENTQRKVVKTTHPSKRKPSADADAPANKSSADAPARKSARSDSSAATTAASAAQAEEDDNETEDEEEEEDKKNNKADEEDDDDDDDAEPAGVGAWLGASTPEQVSAFLAAVKAGEDVPPEFLLCYYRTLVERKAAPCKV